MTVYVRAATRSEPGHRGHITGSVLHLGVFAREAPGDALIPHGRWVPLCGGRASVEAWRITGPAFRGWDAPEHRLGLGGHSHWPVCQPCRRRLVQLVVDAQDQVARSGVPSDETGVPPGTV